MLEHVRFLGDSMYEDGFFNRLKFGACQLPISHSSQDTKRVRQETLKKYKLSIYNGLNQSI